MKGVLNTEQFRGFRASLEDTIQAAIHTLEEKGLTEARISATINLRIQPTMTPLDDGAVCLLVPWIDYKTKFRASTEESQDGKAPPKGGLIFDETAGGYVMIDMDRQLPLRPMDT